MPLTTTTRHLMAIAATFMALSAAPTSWAAEGAWANHEAIRARLLSPLETAGNHRTFAAGLQIDLAEGWKTYWRSPGDAGIPATIDWSASKNVASVALRWPAPERFTIFGVETFGYHDEVVLPLEVTVDRPGAPVSLRGVANLLACSELCVPVKADISLDLPAGAAGIDPEAANLLARFQASVPDDGTRSGLTVRSVQLMEGETPGLRLALASTQPIGDRPDIIVESGRWSFGRPEFSFTHDRRTATAILPVEAGPDPIKLVGAEVTATLIDRPRAAESRLRVLAPAAASGVDALLAVLGVALLGGLILNAMPCVLPVLSLKLMSVIDQQGRSRRQIRVGFLATAAGAATSMIGVGVALAALQTMGAAVGWGMQFQQPEFLIVMSALLFLFAASLAGAFAVPLPSGLATRLGTIGGDGLAGHFLTGAFATLLATPCSAPFLGTAVGFALARGPAEILAIFAALGVGLSVPYLTVAAVPSLIRLLPRPGRWMTVLRLTLAIALAGTAVWLLSVLAAQTSLRTAIQAGTALLLIPSAATLAARSRRAVRNGAIAFGAAALAAALAVPAISRTSQPQSSLAAKAWAPFHAAAIPRLIAQGKVVFVDVTADWCVTCIVNKRAVLDQEPVADALASEHVAAMQADWTRPDDAIASFLARYDRYGIPFDIVFGPGNVHGILLPEILTKSAVLEALKQAAGSPTPAAGAETGENESRAAAD